MAARDLTQGTRALLLIAEIGVLLLACYLGFGTWFPALSDSGLWFYAALISLLLGSRLVTPFYVKPVDAIAYGVAALVSVVLATHWEHWGGGEKTVYFLAVLYSGIVTVAAFLSIVLKDRTDQRVVAIADSLRITAGTLGSPRAVFSLVMLFAAYVFHRQSPTELFWIGIAWATTVAFSPLEGIASLTGRIGEIRAGRRGISTLGQVAAYQTPNIILIHQDVEGQISPGTAVLVRDEHLGIKTALTLDYVGRDKKLLLRAMEVGDLRPTDDATGVIADLAKESAAVIENSLLTAKTAMGEKVLANVEYLVGIVAPDTSIEKLAFEITMAADLEEGRLVETYIQAQPVMYQLINGLTKEEIVSQKNSYGYVRAEARKIGSWSDADGRFLKVSWLPNLNTPVFLLPRETPELDVDQIGYFPGSRFGVQVKDINGLVTHNTAILGILGVGKSMLAIELVERMIANKIKVVCLDLTNQYAEQLEVFVDSAHEAICLAQISEAGEKDAQQSRDNPEEGGSLPNLQDAIFQDLKIFLDPKNERYLKIYNPAAFTATRQEFEPKNYQEQGKWKRSAALWSVTPVEITRVITECVLELLQDKMVDYARCCIVFEEAHSLVPEWSSAAADNDKSATNGTARAILQGRKYGLGCLLITQRTANVTKTILNQCNTIFAMRTFDETGMEFLGNYLGKDYAGMLPSLAERQAVFFGRASSCENPVLIQLNDRKQFVESFRATFPPKPLPKSDEAAQKTGSTEENSANNNPVVGLESDTPF